MKRKPEVTTVLFVLLLLVGLGVLFYPTLSDLYTKWQLQKEIGRYNQVAEAKKTDYSDLWAAAEEYNRYLAGKESQFTVDDEEREYVSTLLNPLGNSMMGYIDIPKISVHIPVYQGTEEQELQSGAGWWIGSSLPAGGESTHCIITAHTGIVKAKLFTDLDQLEVGDRFTLSVLDRELTYEVDQILVTEPSDLSELYIVDGKDYVTLYTCTPYGINTHRLLVRGVRVETEETEKSDEAEQKEIWIFAALAAIILILVCLFCRRVIKRKWENES